MRLRPFSIALLMSLPLSPARAEGAKVEVQLLDGRTISGELCAVRDSALILATDTTRPSDQFTTAVKGYSLIKSTLVGRVIVRPESKVLTAAGTGLLLGAGIGALVGFASGDDTKGFLRFSAGEKALLGGALLGAAGLLTGFIVGIAQSSGEKDVEPLPNGDFSTLKQLSRYKAGEPGLFKEIP